VDLRHFELHDLLCEALIAVEARDYRAAAAAVQRAIDWVEADWLATPSDARPGAGAPPHPDDADEDD
jgi:hypothetical protein